MTEFVGLRAKMYACRVPSAAKPVTKKAKGIKSYVIKSKITFEDYVDCLFNNTEMSHRQNSIRSFGHVVFSINQQKTSLSPYDDKRFLLQDSVKTLPWGHFSIMES